MALTAAAIKSATKSRLVQTNESDRSHLQMLSNGGLYWRMNSRFDGKHKT